MIATTIAAGIASKAIYDMGKKSQGEIRDLITGEKFSTPMLSLQKEFDKSLKEALQNNLSGISAIQDTEIEEQWDRIIEDINSLETAFVNKEDAIERIADSVITTLESGNEENRIVRGKIEIAVAQAYREAVTSFLERIEDEGLSTEFQNKTNLQISRGVDKIEENLRRVETRIIQQNDSEIRNEGFVRFDPLYFRRKESGQPETAWRQGFNHIEIKSGYAIRRERPTDKEGERKDVVEEIIQLLENNEEVAVIGEPGSGKSTICKQVAGEWHKNNPGSVFYRGSNSVAPFRNPGTLIEAINSTDQDALVVVEDAVHEDAAILFELIDEFQNESDVSFLFDARMSQWNGSENAFEGPKTANLSSQVKTIRVPELDVIECGRIIEHFEELTDEEIERSADSLFSDVSEADYGDLLHLAYLLTSPVSGSSLAPEGISAFEYDIYQAFNTIDGTDDLEDVSETLKHKVGILVNLLNASRLPVSKEFIHSIASEPEDHWHIETTLDFLEGTVITSDSDELEYRTFHERWSTLYLSRSYNELDIRAVSLFEDCIEALIHLPENKEQIELIQDWLPEEADALSNIQLAPQRFAEYFTTQIARIATRKPELAPLFLSCDISFSETESTGAEVSWANIIGLSAVYNSKYEASEKELEKGLEILSGLGDETDQMLSRKAVLLENLGTAKRKQGKLRESWDYHKESLEISEELEDTIGIAESLNNLGSIQLTRKLWDEARFSFEESLELKRQENDKSSIPATLDNLGILERHQGNLDESESFHEKALAIERELGRDHEVAKTLVNLGLTLIEQEEFEQAEKTYEKTLDIFEEIGDDHGIVQSIGNLGLVEEKRGNKKEAISRFKDAFEKFNELNSADQAIDTARNIALLYDKQNNDQKVREWCNKGERLAEGLGRTGQAKVFKKIRTGEFERK